MSVESVRKLKMTFTTDSGDDRNVTLNHVRDDLKEGEGATLVQEAMAEVLSQQPLDETVTAAAGAQIIETTTTDITF